MPGDFCSFDHRVTSNVGRIFIGTNMDVQERVQILAPNCSCLWGTFFEFVSRAKCPCDLQRFSMASCPGKLERKSLSDLLAAEKDLRVAAASAPQVRKSASPQVRKSASLHVVFCCYFHCRSRGLLAIVFFSFFCFRVLC